MPKAAARVDVVLFHSVLGRTPGFLAFAERLRDAEHRVHTPDLYHGEVFGAYDEAFAFLERFGGVPRLIARTHEVAATLPTDVAYAGFSNGAGSAELLALTREGARGALLVAGCAPVATLGVARWPATLPVQLHIAARDPFRDPAFVEPFVADVRASGAPFALLEYDSDGHLFADPGLPDHDAAAAALLAERAVAFLGGLPARG